MLKGCVAWPETDAERYRAAGIWTGELLGEIGREGARRHPGRTAVVDADGRMSYAELDAAADRFAAGLHRLGLRAEDRVVVQLPNTAAFVVVALGLFRLGAVPVFALPSHREAELTYLARHTEARALVVPDRFGGYDHRPLAATVAASAAGLDHVIVAGEPGPHLALSEVRAEPRDLPAPDPGDVAFFLLSGGTTGLPKLIPRTHDDYAYQLRRSAEALGVDEHGVYLASLPAAHNAALGCPGVLGTLRAGGRVVLSPTPSPDDVFPLITTEGVTLTTLMPPLLAVWLDLAGDYGVDLSGVLLEVGGAPLRPEVAREILSRGLRLSHWFGMAEGPLWYTRLDDPPETIATTQGRPLIPADEYRVVDEHDRDVPPGGVGEFLVRGPTTLRGYYDAPEYNATAFTADGYLRTGDLVRLTPDGNLMVAGRIKDVINRGGEKIGAAELESQIEAHPAVRAAAVIAVPDPALGEKICAVVVRRDDGGGLDLAELRAFLTGRGLAAYKLPDRLEVVPAFSHTGAGKVDKRALRRSLTGDGA
ncbi:MULTISPECIES: AMP-binding protein [unclassified Micromonospora]|uniref:(2,3-dihydroxybenzoyl)adenylate synthase n=1 Tax=unclassified Micromonospora TaxID=2617518 RepID=UPI001C22308B|nr:MULTISPECIES: AMP-binding protein [unclassified Micromonospora]MBU8860479.1 AMP-binding protein [Micromonospora sp. WMMB482]MDM4780016.1 AMP-binding protein [Micromonospora sp. b486]